MAENNQINIGVGFTVDKKGLQDMQSMLQQIVNQAADLGPKASQGLKEAATTAQTLDKILEKTFNTELGSLNVTKFNQELKKSNLSVSDLKAKLSQAGNMGATAYNQMARSILGTNIQLKETNKLLDRMAGTFANVARYTISSKVVNSIVGSVEKAYSYTKDLNESLNNIRIVTGQSADQMDRFAIKANEAAKDLGASTLDYTNAALIYYQQGLSDQESQARAETTVKAANITGQTGEEVSEQLTAVWNGYKVTAEETELYVDKLAAVAASTAADLEELSVGMSKVASAANAMGVDFDDLNAQIATIVSVTRQAPESVGTALKTIYARLGDLKVDGVDEFGVKLGEVSSQLQTMGIEILDENGNMRDMTSVMTEVAEKWNTWTDAQQQAAAVAMAGKRQYNNLIALFENWDMYSESLETSANAMGTLQQQQDIYMESTEAKLQKLKATTQDLYTGLVDDDELNSGIEALTNLVQVFDNFIDSFGGGIKSIAALGVVIANIFNKQISNAIISTNQRFEIFKNNLELVKEREEVIANKYAGLNNPNPQQMGIQVATAEEVKIAEDINKAKAGLTQETANELIELQKEVGSLVEEKTTLDEIIRRKAEILGLNEADLVNTTKQLVDVENLKETHSGIVETAREELESDEQKLNNLKQWLNKYELIKESSEENEVELEKINKDYELIKEQVIKISKLLEEEGQYINSLNAEELYENREKILDITENAVKESEKDYKSSQDKLNVLEDIYKLKDKSLDLDVKERDVRKEINQKLEAAKKGGNITANVTAITSALGSLTMAWGSVSSLMDTWMDDSASFGDKIAQTFMTASMAVPSLISSYQGLSKALLSVKAATEGVGVAQAVKNTIDKQAITFDTLLAVTKNKLNKEDAKAVASILKEVAARASENGITEASVLMQEAKNIADSKGIVLSESMEAVIAAVTAAKTGDLTVTEALTVAMAALEAETAPFMLIIMAVMAALIAIVAIIAGVVKHIKKQREEQVKLSEATLEDVKAKQAQIEANKELKASYEELYDTYKQTGEQTEDLRQKALELADAYNDEGARLLALAGNYEEFNKRIKADREEELGEEIKNAKMGASAASNKAVQEMAKGRGSTYGTGAGQYRVNLGGNKAYKGLAINKYTAGPERIENQLIDYENNPQELLEYMDAVRDSIEYIQALPKEQQKAYKDIYDKLLEEQEQFADSYEDIVNQVEILNNAEIESAFSNFNFDDASTEQLYNKIAEVKEALKDTIPEDKLDDYINSYLKGIDSVSTELSRINVAEELAKKNGEEDAEKYVEQLQDFNESQLALLQIHLDTGLLDEDLDKWLEENSAYIKLAGEQGSAQGFKDLIGGAGEEKYSEDQAASIYNDNVMASHMAVNEDTFNNLDAGQQINEITAAYIENTKAIEENKEASLANLEAKKAELEAEDNEMRVAAEAAEEDSAAIKEAIKNSENYKNREEELIEILRKRAEGTELTETEQAALNGFIEESTDITEANVDSYAKAVDATYDYQDACNEINSEIDSLKNNGEDYEEVLNALTQAQKNNNAAMDSIQGAYQSLTSMVEDFNNTGAWTVDNLQKLMEMDNAYVSTLNFENGQLSLNESAFQAMTIAKIDDMEQTAVLTAQEELQALAAKEAGDASLQASGEIQAATIAAQEGAAAALEGAKAWEDYANSMRKAFKVDGSEYDAEANKIMTSLKNRLLAAENTKSQIRSGGGAMKKALGGRSSGSGSGSGNKQKDKELKSLEDEFDRYWELNKAIDAVDRSIKQLDKDKSHLYRNELADALVKENKLIKEQIKNYKKLLAEQVKEAGELQGKLANNGVTFDKNGNISNYAAATQGMTNWYNQGVIAHNAGQVSDDDFSNIYEKGFEAFKKNLERYDTLFYKEIKDTQDKIDEATRKTLENNLKKWQTKIELKLELKELDRDWNDFLTKINTDFRKVSQNWGAELKKSYTDFISYVGKKGNGGSIKIDTNKVNTLVKEYNNMMSGKGSSMFQSISEIQDAMREANSQLQEDAEGAYEAYQDAWDSYMDGIDQAIDRSDDLHDRFEKISEELEFQGELIELVYGEEAYDLMSSLYDVQKNNSLAEIESLRQESNMWEKLWRDSGATMKNQANWTEDQKKYYDQWQEAQSSLNDKVIEHINLLKNDYLNTINSILKELEKGLTGGSTLEDVNTQWERISDHSDRYLDNIEKSYNIQKLANKFNQSINETTNLKAQQKLVALRDRELKELREKKELTQYDLDAAEARYQIALKEIALENAQNNKNSMKLTRNEQGNWSYQYVADDKEIMDKQQDLSDAIYNLYEISVDAYEEALEKGQKLLEDYLENMRIIAEDTTLTEEQKNAKLLELDRWYQNETLLLAQDTALIERNLTEAGSALILDCYNRDKIAYQYMTDQEKIMLNNMINSNIQSYTDLENKIRQNYNNMGIAAQSMINTTLKEWDSSAKQIISLWVTDKGSVQNQITGAYSKIISASSKYRSELQTLQNKSKVVFLGENGVKKAIDKTKDSTDKAKKAVNDYVEKTKKDLPKARDKVKDMKTAWDNVKSSIEKAIGKLQDYIKKMESAKKTADELKIKAEAAVAAAASAGTGSGGSSGGSSVGSSSGATTVSTSNGVKYDVTHPFFTGQTWTWGGSGAQPHTKGVSFIEAKNKAVSSVEHGNVTIKNTVTGKTKTYKNANEAERAVAFDTGGYTGTWGSSGRLGMLHQKELVLNKEDTENFLSGINMIRDMSRINGSINDAIIKSMANMMVTVGSTKAGSVNGIINNETTGDNVFNITAEFPNANDVNDIREAILSLPNLASQYINTNRK